MYTADWNSIKLSAAYTYTWMESAARSAASRLDCDLPRPNCVWSIDVLPGSGQPGLTADLHQIGGSIMHKPSGLGIFGSVRARGDRRNAIAYFVGFDGSNARSVIDPVFFNINTPDTDTWYVKPFWRKVWVHERGGARLARRHHDLR